VIRWHSTTCKNCAHYLWNSPGGGMAGYGCAVLADLGFAPVGDGPCPQFVNCRDGSQLPSRLTAGKHLENQSDYASDLHSEDWSAVGESVEWAAPVCETCGEPVHQCRCDLAAHAMR
jgi:hypothetical protein